VSEDISGDVKKSVEMRQITENIRGSRENIRELDTG